MQIEVWSDVVCPWCYIGKRRLEKALSQFDEAADVRVEWRSFQLDPTVPKGSRRPVYEHLAEKFGGSPDAARAMTEQVRALAAADGLDYDFDRAVVVNTVDAHRLSHLAATHDLGPEMHERLLRGHLVEGEVLDDPDTLVRLGVEVGVPAAEAREVLAGDRFTPEVAADAREAQALGANGVPFFVLDRAFGVSGAQSVDVFLQALRSAQQAAVSRSDR